MFVYQGKLDWYHYAVNETFVIVLPNGPVRVGDSVYLFSQWTKDAQGNQKRNWFETIIVDSITQTKTTDVTFHLKGAWYKFEITTKDGYKGLSVIMRNPTNGESKPLPLERIWQSEKELTGTTRIWTGKFSWMHFAKNEPAIFIVPDGFGEGKPILSTWQYTQDSAGKLNDPSFRSAVQKNVSGSDEAGYKFSYHSYYDISCTWEAKTDKLAVHVQEGGHGEDVGSMIRSAIIERQAHTHDFNPPLRTPTAGQVELSLPQAQTALPRILTPLPFPKGLFNTLAQTAAFVDQAGYLAKYAEDRFAALDADYHAALQRVDASEAKVKNLGDNNIALTLDRDAARAEADRLQKELAEAKKVADGLREKVRTLEDEKHADAFKDAEERKILDDTTAKLRAAEDKVLDLQAQLSELRVERDGLKATNATLLDENIKKETDISRLTTELNVQRKSNEGLIKENDRLTADKRRLDDLVEKLQKEVDGKKKAIARLDKDIDDANKRNTTLARQLRESRDQASVAIEELETAQQQLATEKRKNGSD